LYSVVKAFSDGFLM